MDTIAAFPRFATSRIALGCGRLSGGALSRQSARVIETALELGVSHFDVAPLYGAGLAERVLGQVVGDVPGIAVVTKAGIDRPRYGLARTVAQRFLRPVARRLPALAAKAAPAASPPVERPTIAAAQVEASLRDSLRELRRERVEGLLLHEPPRTVSGEVVALLESLRERGVIDTHGAGTGADGSDLPRVGSIAQFRWTPANAAATDAAPIRVRHGLLRSGLPWLEQALSGAASDRAALAKGLGFDLADPDGLPALLVTMALALDPQGIVLVSTNRPARLRRLLGVIDWPAARGERPEFLRAAAALCAAGGGDGPADG